MRRVLLGLGLTVVVVAAFATSASSSARPSERLAPLSARHLKVGYVPDWALPDSPINRNAVAGLRRAVRTLGVTGRVLTPSPREGYGPPFEALARQHYDLIVGFGGAEAPVLEGVARKFPRIRFAIIDVPREDLTRPIPANVTGIVFQEQQVAYLVGYLAGLVERRRPGPDIVSAVGGFPIPPVNRFIAGYRAGVLKADPHARVLHDYANEFLVQATCAAVASQQIAKGSRVVFNVAGACGIGALQAAKAHHAWGIGVDADQSYLGPFIMTSAVKRLDVAVFDTIRALARGRYRSGVNEVFGLRNGGTSLGKVSARIPRSFVARVQRIQRRIVAGAIVVPTTL